MVASVFEKPHTSLPGLGSPIGQFHADRGEMQIARDPKFNRMNIFQKIMPGGWALAEPAWL